MKSASRTTAGGNLVWDKNKITGDGLDFYGVKSSSGDVMYSWVLMGRVFEYKNDVLMVTTAKTIDKMTVENTYYIKLSGPMRTYSYDEDRENPFAESTAKSIRGSSDSALDGSKVLLNIVDYNLADIVIVD